MAQKHPSSEHHAVIQRLLDGERDASNRAEAARKEAEETIEKAKKEAESLLKETEKKAREDAEETIEKAKSEPDSSSEKSSVGRSGDIDTLRQHAHENMEAAVELLVKWVAADSD